MDPKRSRGLLAASLLFALGCADVAQESPDAVAADPDHYEVEFENDVIRVLRVEYGPGEASVMHRHPALCAVTIGETQWRMEESDGSVAENTGAHGDVTCNEPRVHRPVNPGTTSNHVVLFEFKEGAAPGSAELEGPDAVVADPDHYTVEFENDVARVIRIRYEPGESAVLHAHPANCVVWLTTPPGEGGASSVGDVQCSDAQAHTPTGADSASVELVGVEMKGRAVAQN